MNIFDPYDTGHEPITPAVGENPATHFTAHFAGGDELRPFAPSAESHGVARAGYEHFDIAALPWDKLPRRNREHDGVRCVKGSESRWVVRVERPSRFGAPDDRLLYVKRYSIDSLARQVGNFFSGGKARREFELGWALHRCGLPTVEPLAYARPTRKKLVGTRVSETAPLYGYLLTLGEEPGESVREWLRRQPVECREPVLRDLAWLLAVMHERGFYHDDCGTGNMLIHETPSLAQSAQSESELLTRYVLIDIDHGQLSKHSVTRKLRATNVMQAIRSLVREVLPQTSERSQFLDRYLACSGLERERPDYCRLINRFAARRGYQNFIE